MYDAVQKIYVRRRDNKAKNHRIEMLPAKDGVGRMGIAIGLSLKDND
jgi:hypothetical protein